MPPPLPRSPVLAIVVFAVAGGCAPAPPEASDPPWARRDVVESLREDVAATRHAADGGGRAWLASGGPVEAGSAGRWKLVFETGPEGVTEGGWIFLQVSPFWGWSTPQVEEPDLPGYTEVATSAEGVALLAETLDYQLLGVRVGGRRLEPGESVSFDFGAGPAGATADRYAEAASPFWFAVDGDADGVRGLLDAPPTVRVLPAAPARLVLTLPSTAAPGDEVELALAVLDRGGNAGIEIAGEVELESDLEGPASVRLEPDAGGVARATLRVPPAKGVYSVRGRGPEGLSGESNALVVGGLPRLLWGDLHGHSGLSDGTGTPEDYFRYARDVAALDVVSLTDHDHWGMRPLALHPDLWERIVGTARRFHEPGRFVTVLGWEWTNWIHGHRHVLHFDDEGEVLSSVDPRYETPEQLWAALAGTRSLTFAHHSAGGPVATDWSFAPPAELEPVTEVASVHGSSEAADSPGPIYRAIAGNYVRDALARGYRLGFVGSGDGHDGHPGLAHLATGQGGLAGLYASEVTREAVLEALRARRVYATNGPRIVLTATLGGSPMGSDVAAAPELPLAALAVGTAPIDRIDIVRSGSVVDTVSGRLERRVDLALPVRDWGRGDYLYLRVIQIDGGTAWSSPFFAPPAAE